MLNKLNEEHSDLCWVKSDLNIDSASSEIVGYEYPNSKEIIAIAQTRDMLEIKVGRDNNEDVLYISSKDHDTLYKTLSNILKDR
tara:strand:- start:7444 stop:7695 length:252 start_codon:yes stop_codon:yes gene_type:complete